MAIDGQVLRSLGESWRTIAEATTGALEQARGARMSGPQGMLANRFPEATELARIDDAVFDAVAARSLDDLAWVNDGWCSGRSFVVGQLLADAARQPLAAALRGGVDGASGALAGAVAIADGPFALAGGQRWGYHAVGVGFPRSAAEPMAVDGLLFRQPVPLSAWARRIGADPAAVQLRHPWDLRGLSISDSLAGGAERTYDALLDSARDLARSREPIHNELLHGATVRRVVDVDPGATGRAAAYDRRFGGW